MSITDFLFLLGRPTSTFAVPPPRTGSGVRSGPGTSWTVGPTTAQPQFKPASPRARSRSPSRAASTPTMIGPYTVGSQPGTTAPKPLSPSEIRNPALVMSRSCWIIGMASSNVFLGCWWSHPRRASKYPSCRCLGARWSISVSTTTSRPGIDYLKHDSRRSQQAMDPCTPSTEVSLRCHSPSLGDHWTW